MKIYFIAFWFSLIHKSLASWENISIAIDDIKSCQNGDDMTNIRFSNVFLNHDTDSVIKLSLTLDIDECVEGPINLECDMETKEGNSWFHRFQAKQQDLCPWLKDQNHVFTQVMSLLGLRDQTCPIQANHFQLDDEPFILPKEGVTMLSGAENWRITMKWRKEGSKKYELCTVLYLKVTQKQDKKKAYSKWGK